MSIKKKSAAQMRSVMVKDPTWYKDAIIYELRARSYFDANDDGLGDFLGTAAKLDYLLDLGVTAIWLLPFYPSPGRDDGYDIADYMDVHPDLGTLADFEFLLAEAHKRNIRVITELVLNHTSDQHPWFQRARRAKPGSPERDFYVWSDTPEKFKDARIIFQDFESSNWSWDREANAYFWHRFYSHQPDLNFDHAPVQDALLAVVDFWLEKGVDGLRLDAVPYLYEREGTTCENLPPTHAFLKKLRTHIDSKFENRMLLAEANQWPEDAAAYFGNGDECHMNFHFPVMPRMFMAIHMEDRLPITDIFAQTPTIPDNCQWALFLRNHDELTLEMVTDEERDYMVRAYANEPSMRINLGIRRRLAPLVGNDRHKMELLNGLLFSLPGTPVLYYGDEIGMGDNVYLGDRNGVRTPMQWSADRNAGFSRANPQKMILPIIIDPEYHYEAINVENQQQTPTSLLWWTKRLIALRKRFTAFGRGSIEFLNPSNSKLLVFTRKHEDQTILVVANLSRFVQYAELDLSAFKGMIPIELFGKTRFPAIGDAPYMLSLSAHNFYWFSLVRPGLEAERRSTPSVPAVVECANVDGLFDTERAAVDEALGTFIEWRSWFTGREQGVKQVSIKNLFSLSRDSVPTFVALVAVDYVDADSETYVMPLAVLPADAQAGAEAVIAHVRIDGATRLLVDAAENSEAARALLQAVASPKRIADDGSEIVISQLNSAESIDAPSAGDVTKLGPDGHHTTLRFGDRYVLTIFRKLDEGVSPELELAPILNATADLAPKLREAVELRIRRGPSPTIALVHDFVVNGGTAWDFAVEELGRFFNRVLTRSNTDAPPALPSASMLDLMTNTPPPVTADLMGHYLQAIEPLGFVVAELHSAMASSKDPAFAPEPYSALDRRSKYQSLRNLSGKILRLLRQEISHFNERTRAEAEIILAKEADIFGHFEPLLHSKMATERIRVHGDLHLGNALFTGKHFVLTGFDGRGERTLSERKRKRSPLRDLAGMVRSFDFAATKVLLDPSRVRDSDFETAAPWASEWATWTSAAFLRAYFAKAVPAPFIPADLEDASILFDAFVLERALYQLQAQIEDHKHDSVIVPLLGIKRLI